MSRLEEFSNTNLQNISLVLGGGYQTSRTFQYRESKLVFGIGWVGVRLVVVPNTHSENLSLVLGSSSSWCPIHGQKTWLLYWVRGVRLLTFSNTREKFLMLVLGYSSQTSPIHKWKSLSVYWVRWCQTRSRFQYAVVKLVSCIECSGFRLLTLSNTRSKNIASVLGESNS